MRILITGAAGRLGTQLAARLEGQHHVIRTTAQQLDIRQAAQVRAYLHAETPELVLHCAAMTAVDECALQPQQALHINGIGTKNVALACQEIDAALLYISTNEVFDGQNTGAYQEYDRPQPANPYGYSKYVGEQFIRDHLRRFYIVRTSWLFAHGGRNFIQAIASKAQAGDPLRVVVNEVAAPTYNEDLAAAIVQLIASQHYGIYHLVNEGRASRWTFARKILDLMGMDASPIEKIALAEYPRPSNPPEYSVLANRMGAALGITLRPWEAALEAYLSREGLLA